VNFKENQSEVELISQKLPGFQQAIDISESPQQIYVFNTTLPSSNSLDKRKKAELEFCFAEKEGKKKINIYLLQQIFNLGTKDSEFAIGISNQNNEV